MPDYLRTNDSDDHRQRSRSRHDTRQQTAHHESGSTTKARTPRPVKSRSWFPPLPFVEDERTSLRREAGSPRPTKHEDVPHRGRWDQDPIVIDAYPPTSQKPDPSDRNGPFRTPVRARESTQERRPQQNTITLDTAPSAQMGRAPAPYAYSAPTSTSSSSAMKSAFGFDARRSQSPASLTPDSAVAWSSKSTDRQATTKPAASKPSARDDTPGIASESCVRNIPHLTPRTSDHNDRPVRPTTTPIISGHRVVEDRSRAAATTSDAQRRPAPIQVASLVREASGRSPALSPHQSSIEHLSSHSSPRISSDDIAAYPPSPPRSPRSSHDRSREHSVVEKCHSRLSSRSNSPGSAPVVPVSIPFAAGTAYIGSWHESQCSNSGHRHMLNAHRSNAGSPNLSRAESLPYPVDDFVATMPEERDHQYVHDDLRLPQRRSTDIPITSHPYEQISLSLPRADSNKVSVSQGTRPTQRRTASAKSHGPDLADKALPPCPRSQYVGGYTDWLTIDQCPGIDICPHCFHNVFEPTFYANFFSPVPPSTRPTDINIRCDFSNPWIRLAWLITLQRKVPNLNLIREVWQHLESSAPCPDVKEASRPWFTILDDVSRTPLRGFHVCWTDITCIEILLPGLRGFWVPYPASRMQQSLQQAPDTQPRRCRFRTTHNSRFMIFLDSVITLHENAHYAVPRRIADMTPFVQLVKAKLAIDECPRDNILKGQKWFYLPGLPELTVCGDCHDDVVLPLIRRDSDLAMRFNHAAQFLPAHEKPARDSVSSFVEPAGEASCYLYSPRMRRYFARAVADNDMKYLTRKVKDRKKKEMELQKAAQPLIQKIRNIDDYIDEHEHRSGNDKTILRLYDERAQHQDALTTYRDEWADYE